MAMGRVAVALAGVVILLGAGAASAAAPAGRCAGGVITRDDGWTTIAAPVFRRGSSYLTDYAQSADGRTLFVTNGSEVARTTDEGCHWSSVYEVSSSDPRGEAAPPPTITEIDAVSASGGGLVYIATSQPLVLGGLAPQVPAVVVSRDAGATWQSAAAGLPPSGVVTVVRFAPGGQRGYALLRTGKDSASSTVLYTTDNAGGVWVAQPGVASSDMVGLLAGPGTDELWLWGATLRHSSDAGRTAAPVGGITGDVTAVSVAPPAAGSARAAPAVFTTDGRWATPDGGATWRRSASPGAIDSAVQDPADGLMVAAGPNGTWVVAGGQPRRVDPSGQEYLRTVSLRPGRPREIVGLTRAGLFVGPLTPRLGTMLARPTRPLPGLVPIELRRGVGPQVRVPTLSPTSLDVRLAVGAGRQVRYQLDLPPTPTPLDVFFLIDTTPSFNEVINGLRVQLADIVNRLGAMQIDAQFGVGAFREYPVSQEGSVAAGDNYAYRLVRRIGPVDAQLERALYTLRTGGGTSDGRTSALAAEYQAATGAGQSVAPTAVADGYAIPAGLDAKFRPGAARVVLLVTDTEPRTPNPGYPGPAIDDVASALAGRAIAQVGLVVGSPPKGVPGPRQTMERIALATGAVAPRGGTDCDGDGVADIEPGQPLVCDLNGQGLTSAIVELLRSVKQEAGVELRVQADPRVATAASQPTFPVVNLKAYARLPFDIAYSCVPALAGRTMPVQLEAVSREQVLARATARVLCGLPVPPRPVPPAAPPPQHAAAVAPAAPPPVAPIVHANPLPNPNPNPQMQPNLHAQAGMAANEQTQPQLALAGQLTDANEQLAMSDRRQQETALTTLALGAALCAGCAAGFAVCRRAAHAPQCS